MLVLDNPAGKVASFIFEYPEKYKNNTTIKEITLLVNTIIKKVEKFGVEDSVELLLDDLLTLRFILVQNNDFLMEILEEMDNIIAEEESFKEDDYPELNDIYIASLHLLSDINKSILNIENKNQFSPLSINQLVSFKDIKTVFFNFAPAEQAINNINFIQNSLIVDFALIVTYLVLEGRLNIKPNEIKTLTHILKKSIEDLGYHASLLNLWTPASDDERQVVRNIEIRLSLYQYEKNNYSKFDSVKDLETFFNGL